MVPLLIKCLLGLVSDQVTSRFTSIHIQAGDAPGMIVVEHQAGALLVGVVERLAAIVMWHRIRSCQAHSATLTPWGQKVISLAGVIHW